MQRDASAGTIGMPSNGWRRKITGLLGISLVSFATGCPDPATLDKEILARAEADECYAGIGAPYPGFPDGPTQGPDGPFCPEGGEPKVNGSYVFGLARVGDDLWFGTSENQLCTVLGTITDFLGDVGLGDLDLTLDAGSFVCEFGESWFRDVFVPPPASTLTELPPSLGDWRPPQVFVYDTAADPATALVEKTPDDDLIENTLGLRSAGAVGDLVILAGPNLEAGFLAQGPDTGINLFAFDAATGAYLGSAFFPQFQDIRKWLTHEGVLYTGVRTLDGGQVLRWTGTVEDPFRYEVVGDIDAEVAELAVHKGRMYVTTWWLQLGQQMAGLWMSPKLGPDGLTPADRATWRKVWAADDYEPDEAVAFSYFGGALHSFDGWLYWGTYNFPVSPLGAHFLIREIDPLEDPAQTLVALGATFRSISIFRGRNLHTKKPRIELLYGEHFLPVYDETQGRWTLRRNNAGTPLYGPSGFGFPFNAYTWTAGVFQDQLYFGTFDWSFIARGLATAIADLLGVETGDVLDRLPPLPTAGGDLWRFSDARSPAVPESLGGVGNAANHGIRTLVSTPEALYLGTANGQNLLTDPTDALPDGGWELLSLTPRPPGEEDGDDG